MEILAKRVSSVMEHEPLHPPISQKINLQPHLSFTNFNYYTTTSMIENCNRRSQGSILLLSEGSVIPSVLKPSPPSFVEAPMAKNKGSINKQWVLVQVLLKTAVAPFERVKLLMQNQNAIIKSGRLLKPYNGIFDCFAKTIRNEGFFSLWRGNIALSTALVSSQVIHSNIVKNAMSHEDMKWTYMNLLALICGSKFATELIVYPFLYAGTRMATDVKTITSSSSSRQFNGTLDVFRKTLKSDGIVGLYRGFNILFAEACMIVPFASGLYTWRRCYPNLSQSNDLWRPIVESGFGIVLTYPFDTVRRRMMMSSCGGVKYKSTVDAISQIRNTEGGKSFYSGVGAEILASVAHKGCILLLIVYLASVVKAKKEKADDNDDGKGSASTFSVKWKREH